MLDQLLLSQAGGQPAYTATCMQHLVDDATQSAGLLQACAKCACRLRARTACGYMHDTWYEPYQHACASYCDAFLLSEPLI